MKKYTGIRVILAEPMNSEEAEKRLNKRIVLNDKRLSGDGYLVQLGNGKLTWQPKETFDKSWRCAESLDDREKIEIEDLTSKYEKLNDFKLTDKFQSLDSDQKELMEKQSECMAAYIDCLNKRYTLLNSKNK